MAKNPRFVGLDVQAETIAVAVAEGPITLKRGVNESAGEPANGGETSNTLCGSTHDPSARQLPTNRDPTT